MTINEKTKVSLAVSGVVISVLVGAAVWIITGNQEAKADAKAALVQNVAQDQRIDRFEQKQDIQTGYIIEILSRVTRIEAQKNQK